MKTIFFLLISFVLFVSACKSKKNATDTNVKAMNNPEAVVEEAQSDVEETKPNIPVEQKVAVSISEAVPSVEIVDSLPRETDLFTFQSARIEGAVLIVDVTYGGGCEEHLFNLYWDEKTLETGIPQVKLFLAHNSNNDKCKALKKEVLKFDISSVLSVSTTKLFININDKKALTYTR